MYIHEPLPKAFDEAILIRSLSGLDLSNPDLNLLILASRDGNLKIFRDVFTRPVGYLVWSKVSKQTLEMMSKNNGKIKYLYELNDGHIPLLQDMLITSDNYTNVWKTHCLKKRMFVAKRNDCFYVFNRKRNKFIRTKLFAVKREINKE